jgi:hypothetical protein
LKPRLLQTPRAENLGTAPAPVHALVKTVFCETVLAAGVLLIVGYLGVTPPPAH